MTAIDTLTEEQLDEAITRPPRRTLWVVSAVLVVVALVAGGFLAGRVTSDASAPATDSAEAGFARDMQTHHQQAVEMAMIAYQKTEDADIRQLSYDIATSQAQQAGQMFGWLSSWSLPQVSSVPSMTWMMGPASDGSTGMDMSDGMSMEMPGYATAAEVDELRAASGREADRLFLELMIDHHRGGVEMAQAVLDRSTDRTVTSLASSIVFAQQSEISYMEELLAGL